MEPASRSDSVGSHRRTIDVDEFAEAISREPEPQSIARHLSHAIGRDDDEANLPIELIEQALERFLGAGEQELARQLLIAATNVDCWTRRARAWLEAQKYVLDSTLLHGERLAPKEARARLARIRELADGSRLSTWCSRKIARLAKPVNPDDFERALTGPLPPDHFLDLARLAVRENESLRPRLRSEHVRRALSRAWFEVPEVAATERIPLGLLVALAAVDPSVARWHLADSRARCNALGGTPTTAQLADLLESAAAFLPPTTQMRRPTPPKAGRLLDQLDALSGDLRATDAVPVVQNIAEVPEADLDDWASQLVQGADILLRAGVGTKAAVTLLERADPVLDQLSPLSRFHLHYWRATMHRWRLDYGPATRALSGAIENVAWTVGDARLPDRLRAFSHALDGELFGGKGEHETMVLAAFDEHGGRTTPRTASVRALRQRLRRASANLPSLDHSELNELIEEAATAFKDLRDQEPFVAVALVGYLARVVSEERDRHPQLYSRISRDWCVWALDWIEQTESFRLERGLQRQLRAPLREDRNLRRWATEREKRMTTRTVLNRYRSAKNATRATNRARIQKDLRQKFAGFLKENIADLPISPVEALAVLQELKQTWIRSRGKDTALMRRRGGGIEIVPDSLTLDESTWPIDPAMEDICAVLRSQHALAIDYFLTGKYLWCFLVSSDDGATPTVQIHRLDIGRKPAAMINRWRNDLQYLAKDAQELPEEVDRTMTQILREVGRHLLAPLEPLLERHQAVYIAPYGPLHGLPLHTAYVNGKPLWVTHECLYVPRTQLIGQSQAHCSPAACRVFVDDSDEICRSAADALLPRLTSWPRGTVTTSGAKAPDAILGEMSDPGVSLVVAHGFFDPDNPGRSRIAFGNGTRITLSDMNAEGFRNSEIVLASCSTGWSVRKNLPPGELYTFAASFLRAGAAATVAPLWPVEARTAGHMLGTYLSLLAKTSRGSAWQAALRESDDAPLSRITARAFILGGSDRPAPRISE